MRQVSSLIKHDAIPFDLLILPITSFCISLISPAKHVINSFCIVCIFLRFLSFLFVISPEKHLIIFFFFFFFFLCFFFFFFLVLKGPPLLKRKRGGGGLPPL